MNLEAIRKKYAAGMTPKCPICHASDFMGGGDYATTGDPEVIELVEAFEAANTLLQNITASWIDPSTLKPTGYISNEELAELSAQEFARIYPHRDNDNFPLYLLPTMKD